MTADEIRALLTLKISTDKRIAALLKKIAAGRGSFRDTMSYALISGELTGEQLAEVVLELSDDREELVRLLVHDRWENINEQCAAVQTAFDKHNALHLAPQKAAFPAERVMQIAHSLSDPTVSDGTIRRRARSVSNVVASLHDDFIEANAKFRSKAGLECFVERQTDGNCCAWCTAMAGRYLMSEQPEGFFRRHDNCECVIIYDGKVLRGAVGANGRRGKKWVDSAERAERIKYAENQKPRRLSREQAQKLQADNAPKRLTGGGKSGIITSGAISGALNPYSKEAERHAVQYYESVRHMKTDIKRISDATGISQDKIEKIKQHVFILEHDLLDGRHRFALSYDMAQSWQRLINNSFEEKDIVLLKHEYAELRYMEKGLSQNDAHIKASKKYNYAKYCE